jgi:Plavaka transposase
VVVEYPGRYVIIISFALGANNTLEEGPGYNLKQEYHHYTNSDKTQLTQFHGKQAYSVYLTIGNIPKHVQHKPSRQGQVLLAYLPTSKLGHITNKSSCRCCILNLFHHCMQTIVEPLESAGREGIILVSGNGAARRCFPILAAYIRDYPEQILVSLVKTKTCPICPALCNDIGNWDSILEPCDAEKITEALNTINTGAAKFIQACANAGIKPIQCVFWKNLPYVNIYRSITPDILHQLYQGLLKHLIGWIRAICRDAEVDAWCRHLPPNHHICLFMKGISHLSCVTGMEHDQISRFLLALVADIHLSQGHSNAQLVCTVCAILDFIYLAKYPIHTSETLTQMKEALCAFHLNCDILIFLSIRTHFNIPKLHNSGHYVKLIQLYGAADNFNTEFTERLHINLAKDAYASTNFQDEFPQMTQWLNRKERMMHHEKYIRCCLKTSFNTPLHIQKPLPALIPSTGSRWQSTRPIEVCLLR